MPLQAPQEARRGPRNSQPRLPPQPEVEAVPAGQHLYVIQMAVTGAIKVGRSQDPKVRLVQLQTGCPYLCRLILVGTDLGCREKSLHRRLHRYRTARFPGEWFTEEALGELPPEIYNLFTPETLELVNSDWWRHPT